MIFFKTATTAIDQTIWSISYRLSFFSAIVTCYTFARVCMTCKISRVAGDDDRLNCRLSTRRISAEREARLRGNNDGERTKSKNGGERVSRVSRAYSVYIFLEHAHGAESRACDPRLTEVATRSGLENAGRRSERRPPERVEVGRRSCEEISGGRMKGGEQECDSAVRYTCRSAIATTLHRVGAVESSLGDLRSDLPFLPPYADHERVLFLSLEARL